MCGLAQISDEYILILYDQLDLVEQKMLTPDMGLEPMTLRLKF